MSARFALFLLPMLTACGAAETELRVAELEAQSKAHAQEREALQDQLDALNAELLSLRTTEQQAMEEEINAQRAELSAHAQALASLESQLWALDTASEDTTAVLAVLSAEQDRQAADIEALAQGQQTLGDLVGGHTVDIAVNQEGLSSVQSQVDGAEIALSDLELRMDTAEETTASAEELFTYLSVDSSDHSLTFTGANLYVQSGAGSTADATSGLGNLVIGYDEGSGDKSGAHNLVVGEGHSYSSYGGLLSGLDNSVSAAYAAAIGGEYNHASGAQSVVLGGYTNDASTAHTVSSGGSYNTASGSYSAVFGGYGNTASGAYSAIFAGASHKASTLHAVAVGGYFGSVTGDYALLVGGSGQVASVDYGVE